MTALVDALILLAIVLAVIAAATGVAYLVSYNRLIALRQEVADSWAAIEIELQRRHLLVPQLVGVVRAAAAHEQGLLVELAERNDAATAAAPTAAAANAWEPPLADAVRRVLALRERYPSLNSQQNFLGLQRELATTEDRLAAARRFYNTRVTKLNTAVEAFPSKMVAARHAIERAEFFDPD